ncbi:MAG: hypothetical protein ACPG49_06675 [Chitinophagales bacterium]
MINNKSNTMPALIQQSKHLLVRLFDVFVSDGYFEISERQKVLKELAHRLEIQFPIFLRKQGTPLPASKKSLFMGLASKICGDLADLKMLKTQSNRLVVKYKTLVSKRVKHFVLSGTIAKHDADEYVQAVCEQLLLKVKKGAFLKFTEQARVSTFMRTVIDNLVKSELKAKHRRQSGDTGLDDLYNISNDDIDVMRLQHNAAFQQHVKLLRAAFKGFPSEDRQKLELSIKVMYRILLNSKDIRPPYLNCADDLLVEILSIFGIPYATIPKGELYAKLTWTVNELHPHKQKMAVSALRKWFDRRLQLLWTVVFKRKINVKEKKILDTYFELVVYSCYDKIGQED